MNHDGNQHDVGFFGQRKRVHMFLAVDSNYGSKSPGVVGPLPNSCLKIACK